MHVYIKESSLMHLLEQIALDQQFYVNHKFDVILQLIEIVIASIVYSHMIINEL